jgi:hypothetical protein
MNEYEVESDDSTILAEQDPRFDGMTEDQLCAVHDLAMKRWRAAEKAWHHAHKSYTEDQKFANGDQWDGAVAAARTKANLSVLVYNQLSSKYKYIVNNARRAVPGIKCSPVRGGATKNTAKIFDGLVMSIQQRSNAKNAYIHALTCAVIGGLGAWRVTPTQDDDGDVDISVDRILDPTSVFMDPAAIKQDFSDAEYVFLETWVPKELFEEENGEEAEGISNDKSTTDMFMAESVKVLEYWVRSRETKRIEQYVMNGTRCLQVKRNYLGKMLPIVLVTGEEKHIDGHREYKGIVRDVKDMQILLNLSKSKTADYLGRTGNQTWLVEEDQIEGYEDIWLSGNVSGAAVLPYKATSAGAPQRLESPPPPAGFQQISSEADQDIRSAIGIRDPLESLPANIAGKTLELQVSQSNIGTLEFIDRLKDSIKQCGQIIVDLIPKYLNYAHVREIIGIDGQVQSVPLNQPYQQNGTQVMHDLTLGKYTVTISDGPSYESQRSEASDKLLECAKVYPQFMELAGDIVFRNMDFDGANEIADRLRAQIPPQILAASSSSNADGADNSQVMQNQLMQLGQQLQQIQQENQQLHQFLQQAQQEKATESTKTQEKLQADLVLEDRKFQNARELKLLDLQGKTEQIGTKGAVDSHLQDKGNSAAMDRDLLKNHTDIFKAELDHNAANVTPLDDVPVVDPLSVAADIAAEITTQEQS